MDGKAVDPRERVSKWIEEGRYLLGIIPGLPEENERLKAAAEAAERESERLRREVAELRSENQYYRNERDEIGEVFSKFMNEMLQLMNEMVEKLRVTQKRNPAERETRAMAS